MMAIFFSSTVPSNGISPLLFNAGLVSHYRRYLNPVDPRMFTASGNAAELNKSNCNGKQKKFYKVCSLSGVPTANASAHTWKYLKVMNERMNEWLELLHSPLTHKVKENPEKRFLSLIVFDYSII